MCTPQERIQMQNWLVLSAMYDIWTNNLQPGYGVMSHPLKPIHKSTGVVDTFIFEWEEQMDPHNIHFSHPRFLFILNSECTVVSQPFAKPRTSWTDVLISYPMQTAWITWCMIGCNCQVKDRYLAFERREAIDSHTKLRSNEFQSHGM